MVGPTTAVVFAGGDEIDPEALPRLPAGAVLIAADGGLAQAAILGVEVDVVIGDMDSVGQDHLAAARAYGARVIRHPPDKDATDLDLALAYAVGAGVQSIVVIGGLGGRLDHLLGNALLLAADSLQDVTVEWWAGPARISAVHGGGRLRAAASPGDVVSLIPVSGPASGVHTEGLRWALGGDSLPAGSTRGISNEVVAAEFAVTVGEGTLLVVHHPRPG